MDEAVLLDSYVNESSEGCDVGDYARKHHTFFEVFNAVDVRGELEGLGFIARVSAGLCKFLEDVIDGRKTEIPFYEILRLNLGTEFGVADKFRCAYSERGGHTVHDVVGLRVDSRVVERILRISDSQKSCALLENLVAQPFDFEEFLTGTVGAVFSAVFHNVVGKCGANSGDVCKKMARGSVQVHSNTVHTRFHCIVQLFLEKRLVHIVLILPHSERFRVNLHKLGKRVHKSSAN